MKSLREQLELLRNVTRQQVPTRVAPVIPPRQPLPVPNETIATCGACGLSLQKVMGYVCTRSDCPCFPRMSC